MRVAVVEDSAEVAEMTCALVEFFGHSCVCVSLNSAMDPRSYLEVEIVLVDISMPGVDGVDVLKMLKPSGKTLVVYTALAEHIPPEATELADAVLLKGGQFDVADLRRVIEDG